MLLDFSSCTLDNLKSFVQEHHYPAYRASQIHQWILKGVTDPNQMTNLPKDLIEVLNDSFQNQSIRMERKLVSEIDGTVKYLWRLSDDNFIESVLMRYHYGNSICISTQVGCQMGCIFCASSGIGFVRDLTAVEMLAEVTKTAEDLNERISHIVLMGVGEPLNNFEQVMKFIQLVNDPKGLNIGQRNISLSTCGFKGAIPRLEKENLQITLSVSLHAPDDQTRSQIMPVNKSHSVTDLILDCKQYFNSTGRRISFEYAMIKGVNDTDRHLKELCSLLKGFPCHVNLISLNRIPGSPLLPSDKQTVEKFVAKLTENHISATVRRKLGTDILAACGQLRRSVLSEIS